MQEQHAIEIKDRPILYFDGICHLCSGAVRVVARYDRRKIFLFAPLQSAVGTDLRRRMGEGMPDSLVLVYKGNTYVKSDAVLHVCRLLGGIWMLALAGKIIPRRLRDYLYDKISARRYFLFGKDKVCMVPDADLAGRFLN